MGGLGLGLARCNALLRRPCPPAGVSDPIGVSPPNPLPPPPARACLEGLLKAARPAPPPPANAWAAVGLRRGQGVGGGGCGSRAWQATRVRWGSSGRPAHQPPSLRPSAALCRLRERRRGSSRATSAAASPSMNPSSSSSCRGARAAWPGGSPQAAPQLWAPQCDLLARQATAAALGAKRIRRSSQARWPCLQAGNAAQQSIVVADMDRPWPAAGEAEPRERRQRPQLWGAAGR